MKTVRPTLNRLTPAALVVLAGCMTMSAQDCRSTNWYALGYRDGDAYGVRPQIDQYAQQCRSASVDPQAYMAGWSDGYAESRSRVEKTESP